MHMYHLTSMTFLSKVDFSSMASEADKSTETCRCAVSRSFKSCNPQIEKHRNSGHFRVHQCQGKNLSVLICHPEVEIF